MGFETIVWDGLSDMSKLSNLEALTFLCGQLLHREWSRVPRGRSWGPSGPLIHMTGDLPVRRSRSVHLRRSGCQQESRSRSESKGFGDTGVRVELWILMQGCGDLGLL